MRNNSLKDEDNTRSEVLITNAVNVREPEIPWVVPEWPAGGAIWLNASLTPNAACKIITGTPDTCQPGRIVYLWVLPHYDEPMFVRNMSKRRGEYWAKELREKHANLCLNWQYDDYAPSQGETLPHRGVFPLWLFSRKGPFQVKIMPNETMRSWRVLDIISRPVPRDPDECTRCQGYNRPLIR